MTRFAHIAACALLALSTSAYAEEKSPREVMISAFEASECVLTLEQINDVFAAAGIHIDEVQSVARQLAADGMLGMIDNDTGFLKDGTVCKGFVPPALETDPAVVADIIQAFEKSECRIDIDDDPLSTLEVIHDRELIDAAFASLLNGGKVTFDDAEAVLQTGDLCGK